MSSGRASAVTYFTASMRSRYTFRSLCLAIVDSIRGQIRSNHAAKSRRRIFPARRWITRGGGAPNTMRCEKSASLVRMARSLCCACVQSSESVRRDPRSKACVTGKRVCREETRGRFSSKRNPLRPQAQTSIGSPSAGPRDPRRPAPARDGARETLPTLRPPNPPPPASRAPTERRSAFHAAPDVRCIHQDESRSSLSSCIKPNSDHEFRQARSESWPLLTDRSLTGPGHWPPSAFPFPLPPVQILLPKN